MWIRQLVTVFSLIGGLMLFSLAAGAADVTSLRIKIESPQPKQQITGGIVSFSGQARGWEGEALFARVRGFGGTRQVFIDPNDPWMNPGDDVYIRMRIAVPAGHHELVFEVLRAKDEKVLVSKSAAFEIVVPDAAWLEEQLDTARQEIAGASGSLEGARRTYRQSLWRAKTSENLTEENAARAGDTYRVSVWHAYHTYLLKGYSDVSHAYDRAFEPEKALGALKLADEMYAATQDDVVSGPHFDNWPVYRFPGACSSVPTHFGWYWIFYEHHGNLAELVRCLEREGTFYQQEAGRDDLDDKEKSSAMNHVAETYRSIAHFHVMLANDMEGYHKWMEKFREVLPNQPMQPPNLFWNSVHTRDPSSVSLFGAKFEDD